MLDLEYKKQSGSYYTKPEIVSLILDLVGYTPERPLHEFSLLEPSTGEGAFLIPAIERLLSAVERYNGQNFLAYEETAYMRLKDAIRSIELNDEKHQSLIRILGICSSIEVLL